MNMTSFFQRLTKFMLLAIILCALTGTGKAETDAMWYTYAYPEGDIEYTECLPCPVANYEELFSDELHMRTADALRRWFIGYYTLRNDWHYQLWDHMTVILTDPYIIRVEENELGESVVYCFSTLNSYSLFKGDNEKLYFAQDLEFIRLFRVYFIMNDWWIEDVEYVGNMDEELYPGAGVGTQGFPGLTDELIAEIPDCYWGTEDVARKYLEINGIDAEILSW